jgi:lipopolysaccharide/colanic/teichoic acid biosynthesis glycosyltransferase
MYDRPFLWYELAPKRPDLLALKHALDFSIAFVTLVLLAPLMLVIAAAILVTSGRPILFSQERAGLYGRRFRMLKFRTMIVGAEERRDELVDRNEMGGPVFKVANDPRVTGLGRILRRTSLDELPQLLNVLTGSMSMVGPRPLPLIEQQQIHGWQRRRLSMKPGITGLWQVSGRNSVDFEEWMKLDLRYVDHWSLGRDLMLLAKTLPAVLRGTGAH